MFNLFNGYKTRNTEFSIYFTEIAITYICNLECGHCSRLTLADKGKELTFEVIKKYLDEFHAQDGKMVCLTGGEPLAKPKILYPIVEYIGSLGLSPSMISNGQLLNADTITSLKQRGLQAIGVSINGGEEYHDRCIGKKGAYQKSIAALRRAIDMGMSCTLMTIPTNENMQDGNFDHILALGEELGLVVYINFPTPCGPMKDDSDILLSKDNLDYLYQLGREGVVRKDVFRRGKGGRCPAPIKQIYVTPFGDVCPCAFIQLSFGNIFNMSLEEIKQRIKRSGYIDKIYNCCPPAEDTDFIDKIIKPIYDETLVPVDIADHPFFRANLNNQHSK